ncbi:MAG: diguanylate cyclase [Burkholderiales bacterium]
MKHAQDSDPARNNGTGEVFPACAEGMGGKSEHSTVTPNGRRRSLRRLLLVPFLAQALLLSSIVLWLSYWTGTTAVNELTKRLIGGVLSRVEQATRKHVEEAALIGRTVLLNSNAGLLDLTNPTQTAQYFWQATTVSTAANYLYFGTRDGNFTGVERDDGLDGGTYLRVVDPATKGELASYRATHAADRSTLVGSAPYDPRARGWYERAAAGDAPIWTEVYTSASTGVAVITHAVPVRNTAGDLLGVFGIDVSLSDLSDFMRSLNVSTAGVAYVIDRQGELVAWSLGEPVTQTVEGKLRRIVASASTHAIVAQSVSHFAAQFKGTEIPEQLIAARISGPTPLLAAARPLRAPGGPDWFLIVAAPESDFINKITQRTEWMSLVGTLVIALVVAASLFVMRWLTRDLGRLERAAADIAAGIAPHDLPLRRPDEVGDVARAFATMSEGLQRSSDTIRAQHRALAAANTSLDARVSRLASVVEHTSEAILMVDALGRIEYANRAFERLTGYALREIHGESPAMLLFAVQGSTLDRELIDAARAGRSWTTKQLMRRRDGSSFLAERTLAPMLDAGGVYGGYVSVERDVTARENEQRQLVERLDIDPLTGLLHRGALTERLDRLLRGQRSSDQASDRLAVLFIDLDGFKQVNDKFGHAAGDAALVEIANRLRAQLRDTDLIARVGGDEFVAVLPQVSEEAAAISIAQNMLKVMTFPIMHTGPAIQLGASIGIARSPVDATDAERLLRIADAAMYQAKRGGKNRVALAGTRTLHLIAVNPGRPI